MLVRAIMIDSPLRGGAFGSL